MRISTLFYTLKQGFKNILRNKTFSLASIATIGACIFLFSLFYAVVANFQHMVSEAQSNIAVVVRFDPDISDSQIQEIGNLIRARVEVSKVTFISEEEAWETFKEDYLGEYADGFDGDNPLEGESNYEVFLNDVSMQKSLVTYLESIDGVRDVVRSEMVANTLSSVNSLIGYVSLGIIFILLAVSIFLISNTVSIGITVRKEEIGIMKLIGATDFVVRAPFVIEGILIGIIGSLIPIGVSYILYNNVIEYTLLEFSTLSNLLQFLPVQDIFAFLVPINVSLGVGIGFLGSFFTVRKHLKV
ncbi:ABC transporter permease [bacterium 1XD42-8]|jgi:cell division transport system permease protein|nr:ABC transporter permease [Lachnospiraceae bacterium]RKJ52970.1 ABC transporter permease [bacterium 1XD42-8]